MVLANHDDNQPWCWPTMMTANHDVDQSWCWPTRMTTNHGVGQPRWWPAMKLTNHNDDQQRWWPTRWQPTMMLTNHDENQPQWWPTMMLTNRDDDQLWCWPTTMMTTTTTMTTMTTTAITKRTTTNTMRNARTIDHHQDYCTSTIVTVSSTTVPLLFLPISRHCPFKRANVTSAIPLPVQQLGDVPRGCSLTCRSTSWRFSGIPIYDLPIKHSFTYFLKLWA